MKKVLVFLIACLASTVMFAQEHEWSVVTVDLTQNQTLKITSVFAIDHVQVYNGEGMQGQGGQNIEIGAFSQDGVCRCSKFPVWDSKNNRYQYNLQIYGNAGFTYTFRVFDHNEGVNQELDLVEDFDNFYTHNGASQSFGSRANPVEINFHDPNAAAGITFDVIPYEEEDGRDHYYLIASPVGDVLAGSVTNLLSNDFDLYYFNQEQDNFEWINYEAGGEVSVDPEFASMDGQLKAGRGYLYANSGDGESDVVTLTFPGTAYTTEDGTASFELVYSEGHGMTGWNLMGNPFNTDVYIDKENYYLMNEDGSDVMPFSGAIAPMQGFFVQATEPGDLNFSTEDPNAKVSRLSLNLVSGSKVVDRASVSFGGSSLPKFQINSSSTKLYIPMDGEDFAVVSSEEMGEMPVNFKAAKSGSYTLAVSTEVSFNYLHLIDNMTGADVDLLANPSYSFEAGTTDYASRFKLVFATGNSDDTFAFYSNGSFVISNEGEATVQVVDVTGRMLSSETINGSASISVSGAAGVYMIRLVNGESVKVQKVVVK